jgi:HEAT repeat protein
LRAPDVATRVAAIAALAEQGRAGPDELAALADCLGDGRKAVERRAAEAFAALRVRGVAVDDVLDAALASPAPRRRWGAAFALALGADPPPRTLPVLLEALGMDDGDVRWAAAGIVARMTDRDAVVRALQVLLRSGNGAQRKMALYCLRDLEARAPDVEQAVVGALDDADWDVRLAAITSLARLALAREVAADRLVVVLEAGEARARRAAAAALGELGERSERVVAALRGVGNAIVAAPRGRPALARLGAADSGQSRRRRRRRGSPRRSRACRAGSPARAVVRRAGARPSPRGSRSRPRRQGARAAPRGAGAGRDTVFLGASSRRRMGRGRAPAPPRRPARRSPPPREWRGRPP